MLSKILSINDCSTCKFCCRFKRTSLWETPLFSFEEKQLLQQKFPLAKFKPISQDSFTIDLILEYKTSNPEEEAVCYFLDDKKGCLLNKKEKPFDCSIWPFRIMKKDDSLVIALTPTCSTINKIPIKNLKQFVLENIAQEIFFQAEFRPYIIKKYKSDFPIILTKEEWNKKSRNLNT